MTIKGFRFEPIKWMSWVLGALVTVEAVNEAAHVLPESWSPYLLGAIAVLTAVLGKLARDRTTALAAPQDNAGVPLVPVSMRPPTGGGDAAAPRPGEGGVGAAGMHSW